MDKGAWQATVHWVWFFISHNLFGIMLLFSLLHLSTMAILFNFMYFLDSHYCSFTLLTEKYSGHFVFRSSHFLIILFNIGK